MSWKKYSSHLAPRHQHRHWCPPHGRRPRTGPDRAWRFFTHWHDKGLRASTPQKGAADTHDRSHCDKVLELQAQLIQCNLWWKRKSRVKYNISNVRMSWFSYKYHLAMYHNPILFSFCYLQGPLLKLVVVFSPSGSDGHKRNLHP